MRLTVKTPCNKGVIQGSHIILHIHIYRNPAPQDLSGGLYVARSVSPSKHLAFGSSPTVCSIISHATVVSALLISRTILTKYL